jgi:queuosine precursor transporter
MKDKRLVALWFGVYVATVFAANWALGKWGIVSVGLGMTAPAGVYFAGIAFTARDGLREASNRWIPFIAIAIGAGCSFFLEDGQKFAIASAVAFGVSETLDALVYEPLRSRGKVLALASSNVVGFVTDSVLFLWLAFGSLAFIEGQLFGKALMTVLAILIPWGWRRTRKTKPTPRVALA